MEINKLTDKQLTDRIKSIIKDVTGEDKPTQMAMITMSEQSADNIRYPADEINQFIFESILLGSTMQDAFENDPQAELRGKILILYLAIFGVRLTFTKE